ncbi:MAG: heme-binding domain-containing protein [Flavobacteriales bacterium]|nr:heme-binding domain-containing protein [Flavobacteriales bacterium]
MKRIFVIAALVFGTAQFIRPDITVQPSDPATPVNWWVQHHVDEGRAEGNFSNWGELPEKKRKHFAEEAVEFIEAGEMPLPSYTWMHGEAKLNAAQKQALSAFFAGLR